jgi:AcrR family transcriptional regulator
MARERFSNGQLVPEPTRGRTDSDGEARPRRLTQAERTALSDTRMFNAAMQLISEQGATRTTLKEICERAGYSRGLANYRFGSKDAFLQELLRHFNHAWVDQLRSYTEGRRGWEAIVGANRALENFLIEYHRYMRGGYIIWYESIGSDNEVRRQLQHNHEAYRHDFAAWLRQGMEDGTVRTDIDVENVAVHYLTFVSGLIYQWLVDPEGVDLASNFAWFRGVMEREIATP